MMMIIVVSPFRASSVVASSISISFTFFQMNVSPITHRRLPPTPLRCNMRGVILSCIAFPGAFLSRP